MGGGPTGLLIFVTNLEFVIKTSKPCKIDLHNGRRLRYHPAGQDSAVVAELVDAQR
tara:strand:- start:12741 stop:12908 length:168 start_codon:yes stop_codon:yes gene_type:complete